MPVPFFPCTIFAQLVNSQKVIKAVPGNCNDAIEMNKLPRQAKDFDPYTGFDSVKLKLTEEVTGF